MHDFYELQYNCVFIHTIHTVARSCCLMTMGPSFFFVSKVVPTNSVKMLLFENIFKKGFADSPSAIVLTPVSTTLLCS
jgi:hypothetical protein